MAASCLSGMPSSGELLVSLSPIMQIEIMVCSDGFSGVGFTKIFRNTGFKFKVSTLAPAHRQRKRRGQDHISCSLGMKIDALTTGGGNRWSLDALITAYRSV